MNDDERFMWAALSEARKALGQTSPNPAVGAILVTKKRIIARGHHRQAGKPHAEIECLRSVRGKIPQDATLYVTLEPCSTKGRTGACTDEIIRAGIKSVVIGATDPNPRHRGAGIEVLSNAGIEVRTGVLAAPEQRGIGDLERDSKWSQVAAATAAGRQQVGDARRTGDGHRPGA